MTTYNVLTHKFNRAVHAARRMKAQRNEVKTTAKRYLLERDYIIGMHKKSLDERDTASADRDTHAEDARLLSSRVDRLVEGGNTLRAELRQAHHYAAAQTIVVHEAVEKRDAALAETESATKVFASSLQSVRAGGDMMRRDLDTARAEVDRLTGLCLEHGDTMHGLRAELEAARTGEAEAMAVVLGLEGTVTLLKVGLATSRAELEAMESFVERIDEAGHLLAKEEGKPYDRATCWGEAALDVTERVKRQGAELEEIRAWTKVQADRTALAEKNDLISRGGWQKANAELEAARAENTNLLAELAVPKSPTGQVYVSECTRLHREVERLGWKVDEQAGEMLAAKQSTERAEAELKEINDVMEGREYGGAVAIIEDFYNIMEALPERFDTDDLVVSVAVASIVAELEAARVEGKRLATVLAGSIPPSNYDAILADLTVALARTERAEAELEDLNNACRDMETRNNKAHSTMADLHADLGAAQRRIAEALATEDHAGPVCGHCHSRIGRASQLYDTLRGEKGGG